MSLESDWDTAVPVGRAPGGDLKAQWDKAEPVNVKPKREAATPEDPTSAKNLVGAAVEPMMAMGTGAIAGPLSGLAGLAGTMIPGPPGQGADWQRRIAGTAYEPKTIGAQNAMKVISSPFELIGKGASAAGEKTTDVTGSPLAGTAVHTLIEALPQFFGAKGARAGMGAVDRGMEKFGFGKPPLPPDVEALTKRGIPVTPGQMKPGTAVDTVEELLQSVPVFGDAVKGARGRSVLEFNREAWDDALKPLGKSLPKKLTGQEAAEFTRLAYEDAYGDLVGKLKGGLDLAPPRAPAPPGGIAPPPARGTFRQELNKILAEAGQPGELPPKELRILRRIIEKDVKEKFDKGGRADGDRLKAIQESLRKQREKYGNVQDAYQRDLAERIEKVEDSMRQMYRDQNPSYAGELSKIDDGYARFKIAQKAAGYIGSKEGTFKPSSYDRAVREKDTSKDKRAYTEGKARQQELSGPAKRALSDEIPDSGTPIRAALMEAMAHPVKAAVLSTTLGIPLAVLYSPQGIQMMMKMMTGKLQPGRGLGTALPVGAANAASNQLQAPPE